MKRALLTIIVLLMLLWAFEPLAFTQTNKPVALVQGEGNTSIIGNSSQTAVNKHDQTMQMVQDFMQYCPAVEVTLDQKTSPDYFVNLNREGAPTAFGEMGRSQIMVLDGHLHPIYVSQKLTVKNAVKGACNTIAADWQANGRLAPLPVAIPAPVHVPDEAPAPDVPPAAPAVQTAPKVKADVALVMRTTARGDRTFKAKTVPSIQSDLISYLTAKGFTLGTIETSSTVLILIVDRPISKWIEITIEGQAAGKILWSEKISDGGWGHLGDTALVNILDKVHKIIDARLQRANIQAQHVSAPNQKRAAVTALVTVGFPSMTNPRST